jgi:hypothetical protein
MLKALIPLLPNKVMDSVEPLIKKFEKELSSMRKSLNEELRDSVSTKYVLYTYAKPKLRTFIRNIIRLISRELEALKLKYQAEFIREYFESESEEG